MNSQHITILQTTKNDAEEIILGGGKWMPITEI